MAEQGGLDEQDEAHALDGDTGGKGSINQGIHADYIVFF